MNLAIQHLRCPTCGALLDGVEREAYICPFCNTTSPRAAVVAPQRVPYTGGLDRLWKTVGADFDHDGWFEICGWKDKMLYAIDVVDRAVMWTAGPFADEHDLYAGPGRVYVASDGELTAVNAFNGARIWTLAINNVREVQDPGFVPHGSIWARTSEDKLIVIDRATGARRGRFSAYDSASLFRTLVGPRLVVNDAGGVRILDAASPGAFEIGTGVEKLEKQLAAGEMLTSVPASVDSAIVHRGVLYVMIEDNGQRLDAIRVADNRLVGRRSLAHDDKHLLTAVGGFAIVGDDESLHRIPDGPTWRPINNDDEPRIALAHGATNVVIVHVRREGPGNDLNQLVGLDPASLSPIWQIDHIGYLISRITVADDRVVFAIDLGGGHKIVAIDAASGSMLWESIVPSEQGLQVGGGLVIQSRIGTTLVADTGQMLFPVNTLTAPPMAPRPPLPDELPTWGVPASAPAASGGKSSALWVVLVILAAIGAAIAFAVNR